MPGFRSFKLAPVPSVLLAILSVQGGAAIAKGLFPVLGAAGTVGLRIGISAVLLLVAVRPRLGQLQAAQWRAVVPYGLALGTMNFLFYCALARIPLGLAVTLEFVGPLAVALAGSRRWADVVWVLLAGAGIALLAPWGGSNLDTLGMLFALLAGGAWAMYIVLGGRVAAVLPGPQGVAVGMLFASLAVLPFSVAAGGWAHLTPQLLAAGTALAVLSSALPFTLEMNALRQLPSRTFSILMSLEPAAAAVCGLVFLHERLTLAQWLAVALVMAASAGATLTARPAPAPAVGGE
ncbi:DMT family transporter [Hymenobacter sp. UV11]|nr:transporter [Hymenobacter sp. UV11]TFZ65528.1 DMT family transporter [Hymenobacter sp. UV11]